MGPNEGEDRPWGTSARGCSFPAGESRPPSRGPHLQEYMWFFLTLLRKKPLQPSQLEAP